jgi:hypothetical protein
MSLQEILEPGMDHEETMEYLGSLYVDMEEDGNIFDQPFFLN